MRHSLYEAGHDEFRAMVRAWAARGRNTRVSTRDWNRQPSAVSRKRSRYSPTVAGGSTGRTPRSSASACEL